MPDPLADGEFDTAVGGCAPAPTSVEHTASRSAIQCSSRVIDRGKSGLHGCIACTPHAVHGRVLQIEVTAAGKALLKQCKPSVRKVEQALLENLSPAEEAVIRRWLVRLAGEAGA